jgi:hypothetical protein
LEKLVRDKHYSLLRKSVNYGRKKFFNIGPSKDFADNDKINLRHWLALKKLKTIKPDWIFGVIRAPPLKKNSYQR